MFGVFKYFTGFTGMTMGFMCVVPLGTHNGFQRDNISFTEKKLTTVYYYTYNCKGVGVWVFQRK